MALLRVINNPMQDIPLVTVMRSPIGNFTDNELVEIRMQDRNGSFYEALTKTDTKKAKDFLNLLEELKNDEETMTLDEWIWNIYTKTGYMNYVSLMPNGILRVSNLKMLFERAKQYESASFKGLFNFINFIDKIKFNSEDLSSAKVIGENENVVRIMSIHKSKGLEFPVVILAGTGKQFNMQDLNEKILLDQDLGFGMQYINAERHIEFKTLAKKALAIKAKEEAISEEMRVLYVALTRAKEKLIVVGRQKDVNKKMQEKNKLIEIYKAEDAGKINDYLLKKYKTYLDWIELIYAKLGYDATKEIFTVNIIKKSDLQKEDIEETIEDGIIEKILKKAFIYNDKEKQEKIIQILNWEYLYKNLEGIPTKTSVTKLKEEAQGAETIKESSKDIKFDVSEDKKISLITAKPKFINENKKTKISNAEKGTLMHLCVQKMDEKQEYTLEKIQDMINTLKEKVLITEAEAETINKEKLLKYTKSELWQDLKQAKQIYKEQPFYINIKASTVYDNIEPENDENILVQGVIDLFYINKNDEIVLVDFKTDYIDDGQEIMLIEKYKKQLEIYKIALEQSLKRSVSKVALYSLYLNKLIDMG